MSSIVAVSTLLSKALKIQTLTTDLSSLNAHVLLHLMEFVDPVDRFNLVLSGILKEFENANKRMNLHKRYSEQFTFASSCSQIVACPESIIVKLNWGYVVLAHANWKSG